MGPPQTAPTGIDSPKRNKAKIDANTGSPKGTEETAVGPIYLTA